MIFVALNAFLPLNFSLQAEATKYPFKLVIALEKTVFKLGEPVYVTWILTNIGEENVTLYHSADSMFDFLIRDENFIHVYRYAFDYGWAAIYFPFPPIEPGGNWTETRIWDPTYVPLGTYYVSGIFYSPTYGLTIETSAIRITILGG